MALFQVIFNAPMKYVWGNLTYFSQLPLGTACVADGCCAAIDAVYCVNPLAKPFFISGAAANIGAGCCMLASFSLGYICVPAALGLGGLGIVLRRVGKYSLATGNSLEPKPTLTKVTAPIGVVL